MLVKDIYEYLKAHPNTPPKDISQPLRRAPLYIEQAIIPCLELLGLKGRDMLAASEKEALEQQLAQFWPTLQDHARKVYMEMGTNPKDLPKYMARQDLKDALALFLRQVEKFRRSEGVKGLVFTGANLAPLETFIKACTGGLKDTDLAILAHFCWQVKRKMNGLKVVYHTMPVFFGHQGGGKSEAINRLLGPFHELGYVLTSSVKSLADDRYQKMLSEKLVAFADEMAYAALADIESLKNIISANVLTPRKLGTNDSYMLQQNCTFIGASNKAINEIFYDPTGMRRFYEVKCAKRLDWSLINSIDYLALWRGIDETKAEGYLVGPVKDKVDAAQEKLTEKDDLNQFIEDEFLVADPTQTHFVTNQDLVRRWHDWKIREGTESKATIRTLGKRLRNLGHDQVKKLLNGKMTRGYYIRFSEEEARKLMPVTNVVNMKKD